MSNKTQLQTNNNKLDTLITRINAAKEVAASLPEAGASGSAVQTCTIPMQSDLKLYYTAVIDGKITVSTLSGGYSDTCPIVKGSFIFVAGGSSAYIFNLTGGLTILERTNNYTIINVPENVSETATLQCYFD